MFPIKKVDLLFMLREWSESPFRKPCPPALHRRTCRFNPRTSLWGLARRLARAYLRHRQEQWILRMARWKPAGGQGEETPWLPV